jgi:G3E family GTPase
MAEPSTPKIVIPRYVMIGGFLGAGKTTAILKLAQYLRAQGKRVGLITNDQSVDLVDTARVRAGGFAVEEITGGCFCCKFDSLIEASNALTRSTAPDVFIAEPVGSCTDLKATVSYPMRQLYGGQFRVAPLSVLVDPHRAARIMGLTDIGQNFSEKVVYVYRKQLEEAEILVINKIDLIDPSMRQKLSDRLKREFPRAQVRQISCATGDGLVDWFDQIAGGELGDHPSMNVDYDLYADGEALLGWLNARVAIEAEAQFDGNAFLEELTRRLQTQLGARKIEIAHLKTILTTAGEPTMASVSLTRTDEVPHATHSLAGPLTGGTLLINLRAEADPRLLESEVEKAIAAMSLQHAKTQVVAAFRPGRPTPTHRMAQSAG